MPAHPTDPFTAFEAPMPDTLRLARTTADFDAFARRVTDYVAWCRERYRDDPVFVDRVFGHQSLDDELQALATTYAAPNGVALLAVRDAEVGGIGALRWLADGSCEMKRVFVAERFSGRGVGRRLCDALAGLARERGCPLIRIDTSNRFAEALAMYESLGFRRCAPHRDYPPDVMDHLVFMEMPLGDG